MNDLMVQMNEHYINSKVHNTDMVMALISQQVIWSLLYNS